MEEYFKECSTVEAVELRRVELLTEINKQRDSKVREIQDKEIKVKNIPVYFLSSYPPAKPEIYVPFNFEMVSMADNEIEISEDGNVVYMSCIGK